MKSIASKEALQRGFDEANKKGPLPASFLNNFMPLPSSTFARALFLPSGSAVFDQSGFKKPVLPHEFKKITGCPVLVNTSFNIRGEPIVCSVEDAYNCFMGTNLDILILENFVLFKDKQKQSLSVNYKNKFKLD